MNTATVANLIVANLKPQPRQEQNMTTTPEQAAATVWHIGRSWGGPARMEAGCPCRKAACGLVIQQTASPDCDQHGPPPHPPKTMRTGHTADNCPGATP